MSVVRTRRPLLFATLLGVLAVPLRAQCPDGTPPPCGARPRPAPPGSVAVLTFENRSRDTADLFLAEGLADEIAARLTQVGRLTVTSRAQVRRLRGVETMPVPDAGRALNAAYLVTGGVQRSGARLRVNVELLRAETAQQVWAEVLDRTTTDVLEIQATVATAVAAAVAGRLLPQEQQLLARLPTRNTQAYEAFLRGNTGFTRRRAWAPALASISDYERAVALDPDFADAWAGLALARAWSAFYLGGRRRGDDSLAYVARDRARQLAPTGPRTASASAHVAWWVDGDAEGAASLFGAMLRSDSLDGEAVAGLSSAWFSLGQYEASVALLERALERDPRDGPSARDLGHRYLLLRRWDDAERVLERAVSLMPDDPDPCFVRAFAAVLRHGDLTRARPWLECGRARLGTIGLGDVDNWAIYHLMHLDSATLAAMDAEPRPGVPEPVEFWLMKGWRARAISDTTTARAMFDSVLAEAEAIRRARGLYEGVASALLGLGRATEAMAVVRDLQSSGRRDRPTLNQVRELFRAELMAQAGQADDAIALLETLMREPIGVVSPALLRADPAWNPLRGNPRFARLAGP